MIGQINSGYYSLPLHSLILILHSPSLFNSFHSDLLNKNFSSSGSKSFDGEFSFKEGLDDIDIVEHSLDDDNGDNFKDDGDDEMTRVYIVQGDDDDDDDTNPDAGNKCRKVGTVSGGSHQLGPVGFRVNCSTSSGPNRAETFSGKRPAVVPEVKWKLGSTSSGPIKVETFSGKRPAAAPEVKVKFGRIISQTETGADGRSPTSTSSDQYRAERLSLNSGLESGATRATGNPGAGETLLNSKDARGPKFGQAFSQFLNSCDFAMDSSATSSCDSKNRAPNSITTNSIAANSSATINSVIKKSAPNNPATNNTATNSTATNNTATNNTVTNNIATNSSANNRTSGGDNFQKEVIGLLSSLASSAERIAVALEAIAGAKKA